jgi:hypothetical protein
MIFCKRRTGGICKVLFLDFEKKTSNDLKMIRFIPENDCHQEGICGSLNSFG